MVRLTQILLLSAIALFPLATSANLIVSFGPSISAPVGTDGLLDVYIHSDNPLGQPLQSFEVTYDISGPGLTFFTNGSGNPDERQLTDASYVFAGNTSSNMGSVSNTHDVYSQLDFTSNSLDVTVPSTDVLLATLHMTAGTVGQYSITIDSANTSFYPADPLASAIPYTVSNVGSVTVTATSSVPEPTSLSLFVLGALVLAATYRRRTGDGWLFWTTR